MFISQAQSTNLFLSITTIFVNQQTYDLLIDVFFYLVYLDDLVFYLFLVEITFRRLFLLSNLLFRLPPRLD